MSKVFPKDFWWGAATSGPQCEGRFNKPHKNVFDYWFDIEPNKFFNEVGPNVASNFYNSYESDLEMLKEIGLNSFRTSIQWTRLIKDLETCEVDEDGVRFYNAVIDKCLSLGIIPVMNLHHFDLPVELYEKYNGWESKHVVDLFAKFAKKTFELFGDRVKHWATFNEPIVIIEGQYLYKHHYPCVVNGKSAVQASYNLALASAKAIKEFRALGCDKNGGKISTILNLTPSYPRSNSKEDIKASNIADMFFNRMFLDPAVNGTFPEELVEIFKKDNIMWDCSEEENKIIKENTVDYLGVNYYQPSRIMARKTEFVEKSVASNEREESNDGSGWMPEKYFERYDMPGKKINPHRGWEIYPEAMYDVAINIRDNYKNIPWYVSENGMGVEGEAKFKNVEGVIEDNYRIEFITEHLQWLHKGIEEGSNCFGYHLWTPIDCWSWNNAYKNRYGFIALDLETQEKTIKKSGYWMKEVSKNNGF
ncbi:glycoside hydrolase family 1 protein [Clostridium gasigenes]|uniref:glycoside hydrolase family 1 protein n=1 Tax=Clostridium gasigenes TaxID=94869 RepID=UPI001C0DC563|nr:glycoside hydrolase family 1 protein [Clostridium gasigenes]MBU3107770.1 glycoside hydrolase family 1 protein [Clostridium gasigenes]